MPYITNKRPSATLTLHAPSQAAGSAPACAALACIQQAHAANLYHEHSGTQHVPRAVGRDLDAVHVHGLVEVDDLCLFSGSFQVLVGVKSSPISCSMEVQQRLPLSVPLGPHL